MRKRRFTVLVYRTVSMGRYTIDAQSGQEAEEQALARAQTDTRWGWEPCVPFLVRRASR